MKKQIRVAILSGLCAAVGVSFVQAQDEVEPEPLWAWAFSTQPQPGDQPRAQIAPSRDLRPGDDPVEINMARSVEGSSASYSRLDVRDGSNVIDWFPGDHPPMTDIMRHGPASMIGNGARGCGSGGAAGRIHDPTAAGYGKRSAVQR